MLQVALSGLLMGLIYALVAAGLSLIFGLMDVVNFAHGELLMLAMYAAFFINVGSGLDPLVQLPLVAALMFGLGMLIYRGLIARALSVQFNRGDGADLRHLRPGDLHPWRRPVRVRW